MEETKKVACLYRVSTKAQVDRETNDIPMQQNACKKFIAKRKGWILELEYLEKGISGYKKTAAQRDVLQQVKEDAMCRKFDILLVFMFDRLGRREDETPFILQWFVQNGIQVWSVEEGQQKFDSHVDKLLNYIRFWQSGGESEKTGIRVKEKHTQMIKEGKFCGGIAPYGYELVKSGNVNNKGRPLKKMVVHNEESEIVRLIYELAVKHGFGGYRIAAYLNERNIATRKNSQWGLTAVNYMLRNPIYKGYPAYGKTTARSGSNRRQKPSDWLLSDIKQEELAIIDEAVWDKAQAIRRARTPKSLQPDNRSDNNYPKQTKSALLFSGIAACGYCGSSMCTYTSIAKWKTKDGIKNKVSPSYRCTSANRGIHCTGQRTYVQSKIEQPILEEIYLYLSTWKPKDLAPIINQYRQQEFTEIERSVQSLRGKKMNLQLEIREFNQEILSSIRGRSCFTPVQLRNALEQKEKELSEIDDKEQYLQRLREEKYKDMISNKFKKLIPDWKKEFYNTSLETKKMLLSDLLSEVIVYRDTIEIKFKLPIQAFVPEYSEHTS